ncbi:hypothetical protein V2J56_04975 [Georgenia sp. MJ206]|uniref:hypothetical protein n=1 Tax=Georgenia wangjunii TaxID=3117730 RepID=UPI002F26BE27
MPAHTPSPRPRAARTAARAGTGVLILTLLAGCGVRLETPPPTIPSPPAAEVLRQDVALEARDLTARSASALSAGGTSDAVADALTDVEEAATAHLAALDGVWEPWPGSGPDATAPPTAAPGAGSPGPGGAPGAAAGGAGATAAGAATPADVLALLVAGARTAHDAARGPGETAPLLAAVAISRTYAAVDLAAALGTEADVPLGTPLPDPGGAGAQAGAGADADLPAVGAETVHALDAGRYAFEVVAARTSGRERDAALARAAHLAGVVRAVGDGAEPVAYDVTGPLGSPLAGQTPERSLAAVAELDLVTAWVGELASVTDLAQRAAVLDAAHHAAGQARSWGATLPALPGLAP